MGEAFNVAWGMLLARQCERPDCTCPHALLFVWPSGRTLHFELRTRAAERIPGRARNEGEAVRVAAVAMAKRGLARMHMVRGRAPEVPHA